MTIQGFKEIRRDGNIIHENMKVEDITALGWGIDKVLEVQWLNGAQKVSIHADFGVLADVVPGREFVVTNDEDGSGQHHTLLILNADGSKHLQLSNVQTIYGKQEEGQFRWFEVPRIKSNNIFGVIFYRFSDGQMFQLDIDAANGNVVGVYQTR